MQGRKWNDQFFAREILPRGKEGGNVEVNHEQQHRVRGCTAQPRAPVRDPRSRLLVGVM